MMELTKEEQIQAIYDLKVGYTLAHADIAMLKSMARQLLAGMEQDPVAWISDSGKSLVLDSEIEPCFKFNGWNPLGCQSSAAPQLPQPAVVKLPVQHWEELCRQNPDMSIGDAIMRAAWWNHCAVMLQGAEPVQGWIPCSERMPETDGNYWGWWSESKRQGPVWFIKSDLQAQFQSSEITHWMPLPAAPQQEVKR